MILFINLFGHNGHKYFFVESVKFKNSSVNFSLNRNNHKKITQPQKQQFLTIL